MEKLLYSIPEAGALIGRGKSTAYNMAATGELETVFVGSQRMVPADSLRELVQRLRAEAGGDRTLRLLELIDENGLIDVGRIPDGTTLADLAAAKRAIVERDEAVR